MLFSLTNLKRRGVRDADGEMAVVPKLLQGRAALKLLEQALEVFEGYRGLPRSEYDPRVLEAVMSDYRLARCVEACLLTSYSFVQPDLASLLSEEQIAALSALGLDTPSQMRLAMWDAANRGSVGYVAPDDRQAFLSARAAEWGLPADACLLDSLLALDSDSAAVLTLVKERPTGRELMRQYNRGAVQTLLAHSGRVLFRLAHIPGGSLKRVYFVAKKRGVLVEVEEAPDGPGYLLTLFGPEQALGTADKYGQRLADVSLSLLRSLLQESGAEGSTVSATAEITIHDRPYRFHIDEAILARLEYAPEAEKEGARAVKGRVAEAGASYSVGGSIETGNQQDGATPSFDSSVEAALYRQHRSLEKQGYTHGWQLQREPDPLVAPGIILIPDFAFVRGDTRVFMEIAGFWTPAYRERKLAKLRSLAALRGDDVALVIAAPLDAAPLFAGLPYPVVPYKNSLRATDLLAVLDARYGAREQRTEAASEQVDKLRELALRDGLVAEGELARVLQAFTRSELLASAAQLDSELCRYVPGVGLLSVAALESVHNALAGTFASAPAGRLPLEDAQQTVASSLGSAVDAEALIRVWPEWQIERPSLFEAYLCEA